MRKLFLVSVLVLVMAVTALASLQVPNGSYELPVLGNGAIPHWTRVFTADWTLFTVTDENFFDGEYCLKFKTDQGGVGLRSAHLPAAAGSVYVVGAEILVESGSFQLWIEFWNGAKERIKTNRIFLPLSSDWISQYVEETAPEGTEFITVLLYSSPNTAGVGFFDDVWVEKF